MRYHFGLFEFDDEQLVLRKQQVVVALQLQPARVLACLLRNRERIVSPRRTPKERVGRQHIR